MKVLRIISYIGLGYSAFQIIVSFISSGGNVHGNSVGDASIHLLRSILLCLVSIGLYLMCTLRSYHEKEQRRQ
jgi:hypothetical protein